MLVIPMPTGVPLPVPVLGPSLRVNVLAMDEKLEMLDVIASPNEAQGALPSPVAATEFNAQTGCRWEDEFEVVEGVCMHAKVRSPPGGSVTGTALTV